MPLRSGESFAGFRIVRLLGAGGMGEVYLARHPRLPRNYALKVLPADVSADPEYRQRFVREADMAARLSHPYIVGVHDRGECEGQLWIAMDYVDGPDAGRLLGQRYPAGMPVNEALEIITAVGEALDYAHSQGLLHRDVKPANILLASWDTRARRALLADFGIARNTDDISGLTATNMTVGTVAYAPPEQLMGEDIDGRADQYALAATAYHLLTGLQLFPHSNPAVVISRHLNAAPPRISDSVPGLAALEPVLAAGLAKDPKDRFAHCADFSQALTECARTEASSPAAPTTPAPAAGESPDRSTNPPPPARSPSGRARALTVAAAAVAVAVVAAVLVLIRTEESTTMSTTTPPSTAGTGPPAATSGAPVAPSSPAIPAPPSNSSIPATPSPSATPQLTAQNYALPGCTRSGGVAQLPTSANPTCNRQHWFEGLTWSAWGPNGADGTGTEQLQDCNPYCAAGEIFRNRVQVRFSGSTSAQALDGCPTTVQFYTQMIVAYPDLAEVPFETNPDYAVVTRYNGMPAIRYNNLMVDCRATPNI